MKPVDLIPRQPRRLKQPTKARLREELARAATTIERLTAENEQLRSGHGRLARPQLFARVKFLGQQVLHEQNRETARTPWWRRLWRKAA